VPLIGLIVFLGVYPKPVLERIEPSVDRLIAHVERGADTKFREAPRAPEAAGPGTEGRP
jgi:NADH-quinone oxidoreductase subunit M